MHAAYPLTPAEKAHDGARRPAQAIPTRWQSAWGKVRRLEGPLPGLFGSRRLSQQGEKPEGETHTDVWVEGSDQINLVLAGRDINSHDAGSNSRRAWRNSCAPGFRRRRWNVAGSSWTRNSSAASPARSTRKRWPPSSGFSLIKPVAAAAQFERYCDTSFASTPGQYMHGLWHDVQIPGQPRTLAAPCPAPPPGAAGRNVPTQSRLSPFRRGPSKRNWNDPRPPRWSSSAGSSLALIVGG